MSGILFKVTRREFLRSAGISGGALVLGCTISRDLVTAVFGHKSYPIINAFVAIELNGTIHIVAHRSEMGQGIRSTLAAALVDELEADWKRVILEQADADASRYGIPYPLPLPGQYDSPGGPELVRNEDAQLTISSRSIALYFEAMRVFGAAIRLIFVRAASRRWRVDPSECEAREHKVLHRPSGRSVDYRYLLLQAGKVPSPTFEEAIAALKTPSQWRFIGGNMPEWDARDMVTGKAVYGADVAVPGRRMLTAMIARCPVANGGLKSYDPQAALGVSGVKYVTPVLPQDFVAQAGTGGVGAGFIPHAGVAVLAENTWAAWRGRNALRVEWDLGPNADYDSDSFRREIQASTAQPGKMLRHRGDVDTAFAQAAKILEAGYYIPHLAQTPMEPPVTIALFEKERWEIWCPTQVPELTQRTVGLAMLEPNPLKWLAWQVRDLTWLDEDERETQRVFNEQYAELLGTNVSTLLESIDELKKEIRNRVKVHVTLLGGGFGRKATTDYAIEAAFLARQFPGIPIRVQWSREDDIQFSYYNGVSHQYLKAALDAEGHPIGLLQRSAFTSFGATLFPPPSPSRPAAVNDIFAKARAALHNGGEYPYGSGIEVAQGLQDMPFDLPNLRIENCPAPSHIRVGCLRSEANIHHAFALSSFADEMAIAAGRDCKDYLLELIGRGRIFDEKTFRNEGVLSYDNNQLPLEALLSPVGDRVMQIAPGYPPDTRRLRAVVDLVAKESHWDDKMKEYRRIKGRGLGIAAHHSFLSYVAVVIDVSLSEANELTIHEVHGVIDCGTPVNPDRIRAQMEGGIIYGLSLALFGEITVKNGAVEQNSFDNYPVLRLNQAPKRISVQIMSSTEPPTGAGEPPVPPVAPALANAIVAAGGPRIRELPFRKKVVIR